MQIPKRVIIGVHTFICGIIQVAFQAMISINITAMVIHKDKDDQPITLLNKNYGKRYDWSPVIQGHIFGAYFWGSIPSLLFSGWFIQRFGARKIVVYSTVVTAILTALVPLLSELSWFGICASRLFCGLFSGCTWPSLHDLIAKWVPPNEKGKFMSLFMSGNLGIFIVWSSLGLIIETIGWIWAWEIPSLVALIWCVVFRFTVYNSPAEHPQISDKEKSYILESIGDAVGESEENGKIPMRLILKSCPVWAITFLSFGNLWGLFFLSTYSPQYLIEIFGEKMQYSGKILSLAFLARFIMALLFGCINDLIVTKHHVLTPSFSRKMFCIFSHFIPGLTMISVKFTGCNLYAVVTLCVICQGLNGAVVVTNILNIQELSPKYVGTISGLAGGIGTFAGIFGPLINGALIFHENSMDMWHISFIIAGVIYILSAVSFIIFGSSKIQSFNDV